MLGSGAAELFRGAGTDPARPTPDPPGARALERNPDMMRKAFGVALLLVIVLGLPACGKRAEEGASGPSPAPGAAQAPGGASPESSSGSASVAAVSAYDSGPRAGESPVDRAEAAQGEKLFQTKICSTCHGFGRRITCPDLNGVTMRRTAQWMEQQILHPEVMTKQDPIAHQLLKQYSIQMPNQKLTPAEARSEERRVGKECRSRWSPYH